MIINSTNINKMNNHISFELAEQKKSQLHTMLEIQVLVWDTQNQCGGFNPANGITILPVNSFINYFQSKYNKY
jgi:hypothetical protein